MNSNTLTKTLTSVAFAFGIVTGIGIVASPAQAAVITNGCAKVNQFCTLSELFGGATMLVGDKLFNNWGQVKNVKNGIDNAVKTDDIQVFGIFQDTNAPGVQFMAVNGALTLVGPPNQSLELIYDFKVTVDPQQKILDNELEITSSLLGGLAGANPMIEIDELVGTAKGLGDLGKKSVFQSQQGGNKKKATLKFPPQQSVWARKSIKIKTTDLINNQAQLLKFQQRFSQTEPPLRMIKDPKKPQLQDNQGKTVEFTAANTLNFSNLTVTDAFLDNQVPSINDPILGGSILINGMNLLGEATSDGWFFTDSTYQIVVGGTPVLTADLVDNFLFMGGGSMPGFDSEFQGTFQNIKINNTINSPYLDTLQSQIDSPRFLSIFSDILTATDNLTKPGTSGTVLMDGGKVAVPEFTSTLSLLALGTLGAASTLKRKLKPSKSSEKETTKVG